MALAREPTGDRTLGDPAAQRTACRNLGTIRAALRGQTDRADPARSGSPHPHRPRLFNAEVPGRLFLSEGTVKAHVTKILAKLALRDPVQAFVLAYETGAIRPGTN